MATPSRHLPNLCHVLLSQCTATRYPGGGGQIRNFSPCPLGSPGPYRGLLVSLDFGLDVKAVVGEVLSLVLDVELDEVVGVAVGEESTGAVGEVVGADVSFEPREDVTLVVGVNVSLVSDEEDDLQQHQPVARRLPPQKSGRATSPPACASYRLTLDDYLVHQDRAGGPGRDDEVLARGQVPDVVVAGLQRHDRAPARIQQA